MLEFVNYESNESTLESQGTVLNAVGKGGTISLIPKNFKDLDKRVVLVLQRKDGKSCAVTCSKQVSDGLRSKSIELDHVLNFDILEGESGVPFISMPGGALVSIKVDSLKAKDYTPQAVSFDELLA